MGVLHGTKARIVVGVLGGLLAVTVVAFACGDRVDSDAGPLALYDGEPSGDDGDASGILAREGNCLYIDWENPNDNDDERDFRMLVVFADSVTSWDTDREAVRFGGRVFRLGSFAYHVGGKMVEVGEEVDLGGGGHEGIYARRLSMDWVAPPDPSCEATAIWVAG